MYQVPSFIVLDKVHNVNGNSVWPECGLVGLLKHTQSHTVKIQSEKHYIMFR